MILQNQTMAQVGLVRCTCFLLSEILANLKRLKEVETILSSKFCFRGLSIQLKNSKYLI